MLSPVRTGKLFWRQPMSTWWHVLRSAVGMTHSLRSDLWWNIPFHALLDHFGIPIGSLTIKSTLARHTGVRRVCVSRQPNRCTWVVLWLFCFRSTPKRSLILGPLSRVHVGESLVVRLYSEIDHIHLAVKLGVSAIIYPRWTATIALLFHLPIYISLPNIRLAKWENHTGTQWLACTVLILIKAIDYLM